jgi:hypothetical protein
MPISSLKPTHVPGAHDPTRRSQSRHQRVRHRLVLLAALACSIVQLSLVPTTASASSGGGCSDGGRLAAMSLAQVLDVNYKPVALPSGIQIDVKGVSCSGTGGFWRQEQPYAQIQWNNFIPGGVVLNCTVWVKLRDDTIKFTPPPDAYACPPPLFTPPNAQYPGSGNHGSLSIWQYGPTAHNCVQGNWWGAKGHMYHTYITWSADFIYKGVGYILTSTVLNSPQSEC